MSTPDIRGPKRSPGVLPNIAGTGLAGFAGVILLLAIAAAYGAEALGRFNLLFAIYLVSSQLATLGLHVSIVQYATKNGADFEARRAVMQGVVLATLVSGGLTAVGLIVSRDVLLGVFGRAELSIHIPVLAVGVMLFALNKVLLAALTSLDRMRLRALLTGGRGLVMLIVLGILLALGIDAEGLVLVLVISEALLLLPLAIALRQHLLQRWRGREALRWARIHLRFGLLGVGSTLLTDINLRIDVLVLAAFVDDRLIGIYTLAATLSEAALQIPFVYRSVLAPEVVRVLSRNDQPRLTELVRTTRNRLWVVMVVVAVGLLIIHPTLLELLDAPSGFSEGRIVLGVLLFGGVIAAGYIPFGLILANGGQPLAQTLLITGLVIVNLAGNLLLVPHFGLIGAAVATGATNVLSVPALKLSARRRLSVRL